MLSGLVEPLLPRASELDDDYVVDETVDDDQVRLLGSDKYITRDCTSIYTLPLKVRVECIKVVSMLLVMVLSTWLCL